MIIKSTIKDFYSSFYNKFKFNNSSEYITSFKFFPSSDKLNEEKFKNIIRLNTKYYNNSNCLKTFDLMLNLDESKPDIRLLNYMNISNDRNVYYYRNLNVFQGNEASNINIDSYNCRVRHLKFLENEDSRQGTLDIRDTTNSVNFFKSEIIPEGNFLESYTEKNPTDRENSNMNGFAYNILLHNINGDINLTTHTHTLLNYDSAPFYLKSINENTEKTNIFSIENGIDPRYLIRKYPVQLYFEKIEFPDTGSITNNSDKSLEISHDINNKKTEDEKIADFLNCNIESPINMEFIIGDPSDNENSLHVYSKLYTLKDKGSGYRIKYYSGFTGIFEVYPPEKDNLYIDEYKLSANTRDYNLFNFGDTKKDIILREKENMPGIDFEVANIENYLYVTVSNFSEWYTGPAERNNFQPLEYFKYNAEIVGGNT